jgi:hypothetical protein
MALHCTLRRHFSLSLFAGTTITTYCANSSPPGRSLRIQAVPAPKVVAIQSQFPQHPAPRLHWLLRKQDLWLPDRAEFIGQVGQSALVAMTDIPAMGYPKRCI